MERKKTRMIQHKKLDMERENDDRIIEISLVYITRLIILLETRKDVLQTAHQMPKHMCNVFKSIYKQFFFLSTFLLFRRFAISVEMPIFMQQHSADLV